MATEWTVPEDGKLGLSDGELLRLGFAPGAHFTLQEVPEGLLLRRREPLLKRVHVEPTNGCNLSCRTCVRHSWNEATGFMKMEIFHRLIEGLSGVPSLETVSFWGFGEPLLHPHIAQMIALAKGLGARTEIITNGLLLDRQMAEKLVSAGLDCLTVSIDGVKPEGNADVRSGADLNTVLRNIKELQDVRMANPRENPEIGLEFVAMRRNVQDLARLPALGMAMGASRIIVTNLLPYTEELKDEILYGRTAGGSYRGPRSEWVPEILLPRMDLLQGVPEAMSMMLSHLLDGNVPRGRMEGAGGYCRFVGEGSLSVSWDGRVSPCVPLLHSYQCYVVGRRKTIRGHSYGRLANEGIMDVWQRPEYVAFRDRVMRFDFAPCTDCGGCDLSESNEADCAGSSFPACGDCLWAKGVIQCP